MSQDELRRAFLYARSNLKHAKRLIESRNSPDTYYIFVDGSYRPQVGAGYGTVVLKAGKIIQQIAGSLPADRHTQSLGEFVAVQTGIAWCENDGAKSIIVHYDCEGVKDLANRWSKSHKSHLHPGYTDYHMFMKARMRPSGCKIELRKVKAHSADFLNNWADRLAKMGLYKLTPTQIRKEAPVSTQTGMHLQRMVHHIEAHPLILNYAA
jgi:ribonuclease HI